MTDDRIERFKEGVAELDVAAADGGRDRAFIVIGLVLMAIGPIIGIACYFSSLNATFAEDQNELIILTLAGLGITLVGLGIYLRYALGRFLRFFLLRQLYEGRAHVNEITEALRDEQ